MHLSFIHDTFAGHGTFSLVNTRIEFLFTIFYVEWYKILNIRLTNMYMILNFPTISEQSIIMNLHRTR